MRRRGLKVTKQRHDWDCGVAALAMLSGQPYGDVAAFVRELIAEGVLDKDAIRRRGLGLLDVEIVADGLGLQLDRVYRKSGYLEGRTGILGLLGGDMVAAGHWVVLKRGVIVDPDGAEVWNVEDYLKQFKTRSVTLLAEAV